MFPILDDLSSELRLIVAYGGRFLMRRGFKRIRQAEEEQLIVVVLLIQVQDGIVLRSFGRRERRQ